MSKNGAVKHRDDIDSNGAGRMAICVKKKTKFCFQFVVLLVQWMVCHRRSLLIVSNDSIKLQNQHYVNERMMFEIFGGVHGKQTAGNIWTGINYCNQLKLYVHIRHFGKGKNWPKKIKMNSDKSVVVYY